MRERDERRKRDSTNTARTVYKQLNSCEREEEGEKERKGERER